MKIKITQEQIESLEEIAFGLSELSYAMGTALAKIRRSHREDVEKALEKRRIKKLKISNLRLSQFKFFS